MSKNTCNDCFFAKFPDQDLAEGDCFFNPPLAMIAQGQNPMTRQVSMTVISYRPKIKRDTEICGRFVIGTKLKGV